MKTRFALFLLWIFSSCAGQIDKSRLLAHDYRLFEGTPVWHVAVAMRSNDVKELRKLAATPGLNLNFKETKFGKTLLMVAVLNRQLDICSELLRLGADPNVHDDYDGKSAIIEASGTDTPRTDTTFIKLLLSYGADPNDQETVKIRKGKRGARTALLCASEQSLEKVKVLVNAGADINKKNDLPTFTPLNNSLMTDNLDIAIYLLKKGADFTAPVLHRRNDASGGTDIYIQNFLRERMFPLGSRLHETKMEIVDFLSLKGIDYKKAPIPEFVIKKAKEQFPNGWQEYLAKY